MTHVFGYRAFGSQLLCEQVAGRALRKTAFTGTDERQPIEYANLFGVPFAWAGGKTPGQPPVQVGAAGHLYGSRPRALPTALPSRGWICTGPHPSALAN